MTIFLPYYQSVLTKIVFFFLNNPHQITVSIVSRMVSPSGLSQPDFEPLSLSELAFPWAPHPLFVGLA